jgi:hypothetical protein
MVSVATTDCCPDLLAVIDSINLAVSPLLAVAVT